MDSEKGLSGKTVLVVGTGISGIAAVNLLATQSANIILLDGNTELSPETVAAKFSEDIHYDLILGDLPDQVMDRIDLAVLSPGVPTDLPFVVRMQEAGIPIWGEIELAYVCGKGKVVAITGTNGKTTTTALTGEIMKAYYDSVFVVGNIGLPYTQYAMQMCDDTVTVAEVSSFQLETTHTFAPKVSAILNITEDHLNRHHTMEEYIRVKELITANQSKEDFCILNYEDQVLREFAAKCPARVVFFSSERRLEEGIFLEGDKIILRLNGREQEIVRTGELKLLGKHNFENVMAAGAMAYCAGVPLETIRSAVMKFKAVPHRIEFVEEINGVAYYNDSKGTNPDAAIKGIQAMNRPTLLIGGGYDKESSYEEWIQSFEGKVRYLVLIGQTREKIREAAHACGFEHTILADSLKEAVEICAQKAREGDAVLLSPACASWGQFDNYEQRGDMFKEYVRELENR